MFPSPETVDILAEVSEWGMDKLLGYSPAILRSLTDAATSGTDRESQRDALIRLAAHAVARVERMDKGLV